MEPESNYTEISKYNEIGLKYIIDTIFKKLLSYYLETSDKKLIINTIFEKFSFLIKYLDYVTVYDENISEYKSDGGENMPQNRYKKDLKYSLLRQIVIRHSKITNSMAYVIKQTMEIDGPLSKQSDSRPIDTLHSKLIGFLNKVEVIIARLINIYDALLECKNIIMKFDSIISSKDKTKANIINKLNDNGSAEVDRLEVFRNIKLVPVRMARINLFKVENETRIADNFFQSYKPVHIKFIMVTIIKKLISYDYLMSEKIVNTLSDLLENTEEAVRGDIMLNWKTRIAKSIVFNAINIVNYQKAIGLKKILQLLRKVWKQKVMKLTAVKRTILRKRRRRVKKKKSKKKKRKSKKKKRKVKK